MNIFTAPTLFTYLTFHNVTPRIIYFVKITTHLYKFFSILDFTKVFVAKLARAMSICADVAN